MIVKENVCSFDNLYKSMKKCKKGVMWKDSVQGYYKNGLVNIHELRESLLNDKYKIDRYIKFKVYEPKERDILATRFKDRVFQGSFCANHVYKKMTNSFIRCNCACQKGKGTEDARKQLTANLQKHYRKHGNEGYFLKIDIKDYFGSTLHTTAKAAVSKRIKDKWAYGEMYRVIDSYGNKKGMGLGSEMTQLVQLAVLDDLDHYIKEQLKIKCDVRYMDDTILIHHDKEYLKMCLEKITNKLTELGLECSPKKTQIFPVSQGVKFLGFKFRLSDTGKVIMTVLKTKVKRQKRKLKKLVLKCRQGKIKKEQVNESFEGFIAYVSNKPRHAKRCSFKLIKRMREYYHGLWQVT